MGAFGELCNAIDVGKGATGGEKHVCVFAGAFAFDEEEGFRVEGEGEGPGGSVVVGGFASGVFIAFITAPIGIVWVVEEVAIALDGEWTFDGGVGEGANGSRGEEGGGGAKDGASKGFFAFQEAKGNGVELVGTDGVILFCMFCANATFGVEAVGEAIAIREGEEFAEGASYA